MDESGEEGLGLVGVSVALVERNAYGAGRLRRLNV